MATKAKAISEDPWVTALTKNGNSLENVTVLFGYIGPGSEEGNIRIYFDLLLQRYLEVKSEDVLHVVTMTRTQNALGGNYIWIKKAMEYIYNVSYEGLKEQQTASYYFNPAQETASTEEKEQQEEASVPAPTAEKAEKKAAPKRKPKK